MENNFECHIIALQYNSAVAGFILKNFFQTAFLAQLMNTACYGLNFFELHFVFFELVDLTHGYT